MRRAELALSLVKAEIIAVSAVTKPVSRRLDVVGLARRAQRTKLRAERTFEMKHTEIVAYSKDGDIHCAPCVADEGIDVLGEDIQPIFGDEVGPGMSCCCCGDDL